MIENKTQTINEDFIKRGEHVVVCFDLVENKTLLDRVEEFTSILLLYQRIAFYKKSTSFSDNVKEITPLAIAETITDFDSNEKKVSFIFSLLKDYKIQVNREGKPQLKTIITTRALEFFTHEEIFEALVLAIEYKTATGTDNCILKGMMTGIRYEYGSIEEIIKEYININPKSFEEAILKFGFIKKEGE